MEIDFINLQLLHNEEHFQYQKDFKELVELSGAKSLNIETLFGEYLQKYSNEEEALNQVQKSATTKNIVDADKERDLLCSGLTDAVKSQLKHFDAEKRAAAARYAIVLDQYGNISQKSYDDESAAIHKLVQESKGTYANDVTLLTLMDWIDALDKKNLFFQSLKKDRHSEEAKKSNMKMKEVRVVLDASYKDIVKRVNALITINGSENHEAFVREMNSRVVTNNNKLSQRKGRSVKNGVKSKIQENTGTTNDTTVK